MSGQWPHGGAMNSVVWNLPVWCSRAPLAKRRVWGGRVAHYESNGEVDGIRVGSKMIGDMWWWTVKRKATGEHESMKLVTKTRRRRHLQMRRGTAELQGETSTAIEHRSGWILVAVASSTLNGEKRRGKGLTPGFYRRARCGRRGSRRGRAMKSPVFRTLALAGLGARRASGHGWQAPSPETTKKEGEESD